MTTRKDRLVDNGGVALLVFVGVLVGYVVGWYMADKGWRLAEDRVAIAAPAPATAPQPPQVSYNLIEGAVPPPKSNCRPELLALGICK